MTTYISAAPLTMVRIVDGGYRHVYRDEEISGDTVQPENLKRLVRKGFLVESEQTDEPSSPPAKSASKSASKAD